ncbi:MAG: hypothetical protein IFK94_06655 [Acidobacteria bacterium]|uniref:Uncharacterized protein n=1 Tax=Candidatus Polarisedimenticola svalbardensis TaxID=2886004 RepID=A0A8J7CE72_9BACT|nr:hypothetical protein [Candidatus Polarisedimenticola svalbardensis]
MPARLRQFISYLFGKRSELQQLDLKDRDGSFLAYEGNGRVAALQHVFGPNDGIAVEVEEYRFRRPGRILKALHKLRRMNGLEA